MGQRTVIARVIDAGNCRYYEEGQEYRLGGFTPKGVCDMHIWCWHAMHRPCATVENYRGKKRTAC